MMRAKPSVHEQKVAHIKALRGMMMMAGKTIDESDPLLQLPEAPKPRAPRQPSELPTEHQEQVAFVRWFRMQYRGVKLFAVPNAAVRDERLAAWMKAEGMSAGVPDLCIPAWNLWIEFKSQKGRGVSPEQAEWIAYLNMHVHRAIVCKGFDDAVLQVRQFLLEKS